MGVAYRVQRVVPPVCMRHILVPRSMIPPRPRHFAYSTISMPAVSPRGDASEHADSHSACDHFVRVISSTQRIMPDQLWNIYQQALHERPSRQSDGSMRMPTQLDDAHHIMMFQALLPTRDEYTQSLRDYQLVSRVRRHAHMSPSSMLTSTNTSLDLSSLSTLDPSPHVPRMGGKHAQIFAERMREILLRISPEHRKTKMYNDVLSVLAMGGRYKFLRNLWNDMVEADKAGHSQVAPNQETCHCMLVALVRNFNLKLQRFKVQYKRELLNSTASPKATAFAAAHVNAATQLAVDTVSMVMLSLQKQGTLPRAMTLDIAARLLRITGRLPEFLQLLRTGFGLDMHFPDAQTLSMSEPTTHTLNTTLLGLGELATMPDMAMAFEVLTRPLPQSGRQRVLPNTTSFKLLVQYACMQPPAQLLLNAVMRGSSRPLFSRLSSGPQGLPTIGLRSPEQLQAEMHARRKGAYTLFAHAYIDEALSLYAEQLQRMADHLGVPCPEAVTHGMPKSHASANERRKADTEPIKAAETVPAPSRSRIAVFLPPSVRVTYPLLHPLLQLALKNHATDELTWLHPRADHAHALLEAEHGILEAAQRSIQAPEHMLESLRVHATYIQQLAQRMQWLCDNVIDNCMALCHDKPGAPGGRDTLSKKGLRALRFMTP